MIFKNFPPDFKKKKKKWSWSLLLEMFSGECDGIFQSDCDWNRQNSKISLVEFFKYQKMWKEKNTIAKRSGDTWYRQSMRKYIGKIGRNLHVKLLLQIEVLGIYENDNT